MSVHKIAGAWRVRYRVHGQQKQHTLEPQPDGKRQAEKMEREFLYHLEHGDLVEPSKLTVGALADRWLAGG